MLKQINRRLQLYWWLLAGTIVIASFVPRTCLSIGLWGTYFNWPWVHFLVYLAVSILPVLAWRIRTGLAVTLGLAVASLGLEILRGLLLYRSVRVEDIVVNGFGIAAGALLGLNILTLRSRASQVEQPGADVSSSSSL